MVSERSLMPDTKNLQRFYACMSEDKLAGASVTILSNFNAFLIKRIVIVTLLHSRCQLIRDPCASVDLNAV